MLRTLRIKNFAVVDELILDFKPGFTAITGETGAGKSILIGALNLLLGSRAERTLIRGGAESATVEAVFQDPGPAVSGCLQENGFDPGADGELFLKRIVLANGSNRQFINGSPCPLATLAQLGDLLVDIHGPHEHQSLLQPAKQLALLDAFAGLNTAREEFRQLWRDCQALRETRAGLVIDEKSYWQELDLLRFQVNEIETARLQPGEEEAVEQEYKRASQAAQILQSGEQALNLLAGEEMSILGQNALLGKRLQELGRLDSGLTQTLALQSQIAGLLQELQQAVARYLDQVEIDPDRLQLLTDRLDSIHALKRKYGSNVPEVLAFAENARARLRALEGREEEMKTADARLAAMENELWKSAKSLSSRRRKVAPKLARAVNEELAELGFRRSVFQIALESDLGQKHSAADLSAWGLDAVEFEFAPNAGEPLRPLRSIASSGEIARVMLGLKTVLAKEDDIPVLIFDEVDANVGGETSHKIAGKMQQLAAGRQVLCITHLAPIAAGATTHLLVNKQFKNERTYSEVVFLESEARIHELARMLGGPAGPARQHASALLQACRGA